MAARTKEKSFDLTLDGKVVKVSDIKDAIVKTLQDVGRAKPREIASMLGPEWIADLAHKHYISQTMGNMAQQGWLVRAEHGVYIVHPNYENRKSRRLEDQIIETIRDLGGIARARDILEDFGVRPAANKEVARSAYGGRGGASGRIFKMLCESDRIVHYNLPKRPRWGLPWGQMALEPLTGNNAAYFIEMGFLAAVERGDMEGGKRLEANIHEAIKEHYSFVGMAFRRAREMFNAERVDLLKVSDVFDNLEFMRGNSALMSRIYDDIKNDTERRAAEESRPDDTHYIEQLRDAENEIIHAHILTYFEMGDSGAHMVAPPNFYRTFAHHFHLDAAALSRGSVIPTPLDTDLSEDWWGSDAAVAEFGERVIPHDGRRVDTSDE